MIDELADKYINLKTIKEAAKAEVICISKSANTKSKGKHLKVQPSSASELNPMAKANSGKKIISVDRFAKDLPAEARALIDDSEYQQYLILKKNTIKNTGKNNYR